MHVLRAVHHAETPHATYHMGATGAQGESRISLNLILMIFRRKAGKTLAHMCKEEHAHMRRCCAASCWSCVLCVMVVSILFDCCVVCCACSVSGVFVGYRTR